MILSQIGFSSVLKSNIIFGVQSVRQNLVKKIMQFEKSNVFLVTDPGLVAAGIVPDITAILDKGNIRYTVFSEVEPNPQATTVMKGAERYIEENCDMLIAVGGGSSIDLGKAVGVVVSHPGHIMDYRRGKERLSRKIPTMFAIPTTVGTGSEVTPVSVVTDKEKGRKFVIASSFLIPDAAFIDPSLTISLPRHLVSTTAIDALVHALEAYVSVGANPISDGMAMQAMKMIVKNLPASYAHPNNMEARSQIHLASTLAGYAFGIGGLGLVHSCSHPLSARYDVPHGLANSILLPFVVEHNLISNYERYADIARVFDTSLHSVSDQKAAEALVDILKDFTKQLDIDQDFSYLNIDFSKEMMDQLIEDAMNDFITIPKNPRKVFREDVEKIYKKVLPSRVRDSVKNV